MTNNFHTTKEKLKRGRDISLTFSEHEAMKAELLSYAKYHGAREDVSATKKTWWLLYSRQFVSLCAAFIFMVVGAGYSSTNSLPGEFLYPIKVNVVEEMIANLQFSEEEQLAYELTRFEERLTEVHKLSRGGLLTVKMAEDIGETFDEQFAEFGALLEDDRDESLDGELVLEATSNVVAITRATEVIIERSTSTYTSEAFADIADEARAIHSGELREFVMSESLEDVNMYITKQLEEIGDELSENDLTATTTEVVDRYLTDVAEELAEGSTSDAAALVGTALQNIETEEYVSDYLDEITEE